MYPYIVGVYTGNRISAGTSATIGLRLLGDEGLSEVSFDFVFFYCILVFQIPTREQNSFFYWVKGHQKFSIFRNISSFLIF